MNTKSGLASGSSPEIGTKLSRGKQVFQYKPRLKKRQIGTYRLVVLLKRKKKKSVEKRDDRLENHG